MSRFIRFLSLILFVIAASLLSQTHAALIDFDGFSSGTKIDDLEGANFTSNIGLDLIVSTGFDTTSGTNYLGVDDSGFEVFFPGDVVTLKFDSAQRNFGANFISTPLTPEGRFSIVALANSLIVGSKSSIGLPSLILSDGGEVFSVEVNALKAFDEIRLVAGPGFYSFSIDDISFSAPEPQTVFLILSGLYLFVRHNPKVRQK